MKKKLLTILLICSIALSIVGCTSDKDNNQSQEISKTMTAKEFSAFVETDEADDFEGKLFEITGTVSSVRDKKISIEREDTSGFVMCEMSENSDDFSSAKKGDTIIIVGKYAGETGNIKMEDCLLKNIKALKFGWDKSDSTLKENSTERLDDILNKAKKDAEIFSYDIVPYSEEALDYINNNKDNLHKDNDTMEKVMYYAYFITSYIEENARDITSLDEIQKAIYEIGNDSIKAVKYVYRGAEKIEDETTQQNINSVKENLEKVR